MNRHFPDPGFFNPAGLIGGAKAQSVTTQDNAPGTNAMKPKLLLCLALVLSGTVLGCSADAQDTAEPANWPGVLVLPSFTNADFSITHPIPVRVPTKLKIERKADILSVTIDTNGFESTNLMVGANVATVVREKLFIYPAGGLRPTNSAYGAQGELDFKLGGLFFNRERDGLPEPGKSYVVEADLTVFETDAPRGHFPIFPWSTNYEIVWQRTLKQTVIRADDLATNASSTQLGEEFKNSKVFWQQFEIARKLAARGDTNVLTGLTNGLTNEDRHARGNAAFIFARMGDDRGFVVIQEILNDRSDRPKEQGVPGGNWTVQAQIAADRYYAVHLFGDLKDPRAVPLLVPLLHDNEVNRIVPWALGQIGDKRAVAPLIKALSDKNPSVRVLAIYALEKLKAGEALPRLQALLNDNDKSNFGECVSVAEAARSAISSFEKNHDSPEP